MASGAQIIDVVAGSPADEAGFVAGYSICSVENQPLRDLIDWRWLASGESVVLSYVDSEGEAGDIELERRGGEDWGFVFEGVVFDGIKQCRNACTFCFMKQLPSESRPSLTLRDDDFRLSFLQGTFVTLTNINPADEARIIEQKISPLRVSLHAISADIRKSLIGNHAAHGLACCKRLLAAGIQMHMQIVLVPGVNDGTELDRTLEWAFSQPQIANVGVVPLGFTQYQEQFDRSYNDQESARAVLAQIETFQKRAQQEREHPFVYAADEFYRNAYPDDLLSHLPLAQQYGSFDLFEDGIGIIRSFVDDWDECRQAQEQLSALLREKHQRVHMVIGSAQEEFLRPLLAQSPLQDILCPLTVPNTYFGGNVDVTGLLCGCDIIETLKRTPDVELAAIPSVIFNDDGITLDDMSLEDMQKQLSVSLKMVSCNASDYLEELIEQYND